MGKRHTGLNSSHKSSPNPSNLKPIFGARVQYIILEDKTHPKLFKQFGEWNSIGGILFQYLNSPAPFKDINNSNFAKPLFSNVKNYPLENEVVYITSLPSNNIESDVNSTEYYYFTTINLWNSVHHNAIPDALGNKLKPQSQQQDYQQTEAGSVRRVTDGSTEIPLGSTFKEKLNIKNLLPFEGDVIYEGRWGNSIRFGSTVNNSSVINNWSSTGENGDPILIIRNGQYDDGKEPWIPITEDINKDLSNLYVTSTQIIPIELSSANYNSYETPPIKPDQYNENQIILSSGRLIFNSTKDSILLSSKKTINLNSQDSVNIDAVNKVVLATKEVLIGGKDASEPIILGNKFLDDFKNMLVQLSDLCTKLPTVGSVTPYTPNVAVATSATQLQVLVKSMSEKINSYKSKVSKTK